MNNLRHFLLFIFTVALGTVSFSQTRQNPNTVKVSGGVQDSYGPFEADRFPLGFLNTDNLERAYQIQYSRYLNRVMDISINLTGADVANMYDDSFNTVPLEDGSSLDLDVLARYKFYNGVDFNEDAFLRPYIFTGVSGTYISALENVRNVDNGLGMNVPLGAGLKVNLGEKVHLEGTTAYRAGLFNKIPQRWEHMAGLAFNFGPPIVDEVEEEPVVPMPEPKDSDGDGVIDAEDECPDRKGPAQYDGCPDKDGDGVFDYEDNCPNAAGTIDGCPDTDGDGIIDKNDDCPEQAGTASEDGCPEPIDSDGDGIVDENDDCPQTPGIAAENGCPKDTDGDGIADENDRCPEVPGVAAQQGCPEEVEEEVQEQIQNISENIFFEFDSFNLKQESQDKLDEMLDIMDDYANFNLSIEGHTDSVGADAYNQDLSEKRAAAVRDYLVSRGMSENRVSSTGHGETQPIADNGTKEGRAQNRRVELLLRLVTQQ